jgi:hemoglobin/transferrin/lactoferrin receptor protein
MRPLAVARLIAVACALAGAGAARAQEPGEPPERTAAQEAVAAEAARAPPERLAPVVVTATRLEEDVFDVPYSAESLDGAALVDEKAVRTLPEALRETPGVMVQKTSHGQGSPFIRGFTGFRTLLLIDGIRLNNAVFRDGPNQYWGTVDPLTIERLEVVKGPSSVLYGSDAVGGTVNVITRGRDPAAAGRGPVLGGFDSERRVYVRYASADDSWVTRAEAGGGDGRRVGFLGGVSYKDFDDLSGGRHLGEMPRTGYEELDGDLKTIIRVRKDMDLVLVFQEASQFDVPRTHSTIFSRSYRGTEVGTDFERELDQRRQLGYAQLHWEEPALWLSSLKLSLSHHLQEEDEVRTRSNGRTSHQGFEDGQLGAWAQLESESPLGTLVYGIEYYRDDVDSFFTEFNPDGSLRARRGRGPVADNATYDLLGAYLQDGFRLGDRLEVLAGGRFTYARAESDQVDPDPASAPEVGDLDEDWSAATGSLRFTYHATSEWNVFGGVSQGFRAPNLSDLTRFDVARSGELEVPATHLDPEEFVSLEIGTKVRWEELGLEAVAAYHYTFIDDLIVRFPTGETIDGDPVVTKDNVGDGFVHGVELGGRWRFHAGFTAFGNLTWLEGEAENFVGAEKEDEPFSRVQPARVLLGLRWDSPAQKYWVEGTVEIADNQDRLSSEDEADVERIPAGGTPGYTLYTLRGGVEVLEDLEVFGALENVSDQDYRIHGSGQNEAGTSVVLGMDWRF